MSKSLKKGWLIGGLLLAATVAFASRRRGDGGDGEGEYENTELFYPLCNPLGIRRDSSGDGAFGARRKNGDGTYRKHEGIDLLAIAGFPVHAPFDGVIESGFNVYKNSSKWRGFVLRATGQWAGYSVWIMYVENFTVGAAVTAGETIAVAQKISDKYGGSMRDHVHVELYENGQLIDPTPFVFASGMGRIFERGSDGFTPCRDGKFSNIEPRPGVCSYHGGYSFGKKSVQKRQETPIEPPPPISLEDYVKKRANEIAQEFVKDFHENRKNYSHTSTWARSEARRIKDHAYWYYSNQDGKAGLVREYKAKFGIGAITNRPELFECENGDFSTSNRRGACRNRGGLKSSVPVSFGRGGSARLPIQDVLLSDIDLDTKLYQGRDSKFSADSVNRIIRDVDAGRFFWENFDPITLFKTPEGKLVILSGHSRFEAFSRLDTAGATVDGKDFSRIPAKIMSKVDTATARRVALESNTLSTKETDTERAQYYRSRLENDDPKKEVLEDLKKNEGRNWPNIWAFANLNPNGTTWASLRQFGASEDQSAQLMRILAKWIGGARLKFPQLTNQHENELFVWLFQHNGYGTGRAQVSSEKDFGDAVYRFLERIRDFSEDWAEKPLNIQNALSKSPTEAQFDGQIEAAKKAALDLEAEIKSKIKSLAARAATSSDVQRIIGPLQQQLTQRRLEYQKLIQKRADVIEYSKSEATLFGFRHVTHRRLPRAGHSHFI